MELSSVYRFIPLEIIVRRSGRELLYSNNNPGGDLDTQHGFLTGFIDSIRGIKLVRSSSFIIIVSALLLILNEYFFRIKFNIWPAVPYTIYWLIMAMAFSALILVPWQRYQEEQERLMVEAFMAGIILGLSIAVYKTFAYHELWALFNLLAEPIRTALFGLLVAWVLKEKSRTLTMNQITP